MLVASSRYFALMSAGPPTICLAIAVSLIGVPTLGMDNGSAAHLLRRFKRAIAVGTGLAGMSGVHRRWRTTPDGPCGAGPVYAEISR